MGTLEEDIAAAEKRLGTLVADKYQLLGLLGVGGMGAVYQALHHYTDRHVALKLLHKDVARSAVTAERFLREARAPAAIRHPAIVTVLDAGYEADGGLYLAFELLEGRDLGAAIRAGLDPRGLLEVICQVLSGLQAAHAQGFVHRDIKPANIFLARQGTTLQAKLLDFGIAKQIGPEQKDGLTQVGAVLGTPYFMSPEQMCGEKVDGRADLWAVGVILFYGLSRQLPFHAQNYLGLLAEMMNHPAPSLRNLMIELPDALIAVVDRALAPKLADRFQSAAEMERALRQKVLPVLGGDEPTRPIDLPRAGPLVPMTEPVERPAPAAPAVEVHRVVVPPAPPREEPWSRALSEIEGEIAALKKQAEVEPEVKPRKRGLSGWLERKKR